MKNSMDKFRTIKLGDTDYPERIKRMIHRKAPLCLNVMGNMDILKMVGIGFCGSRHASLKGLEVAQDCAEQTVRQGFSVISGAAKGVDCKVHLSCLKEGGKTILVLSEGINHFRIKKELKPFWNWDRVLVISQFEPDDSWQSFRAMARNSLIIALSRAMFVIEAGAKGGTLAAGKETLKAGIPLYVAEYQDMPEHAIGNQFLLEMGARKFAKSKTTQRARLEKIFKNIRDNQPLNTVSPQGVLV